MTFGVYVLYHLELISNRARVSLRHFTWRDVELCVLCGVRENLISKALDQLFPSLLYFFAHFHPLQTLYLEDSSICIMFNEQVDHQGGAFFFVFLV